MQPEEIEFWENEYLKQIYYLLELDKEKMLNGFKTKEYIKEDWIHFLGKETSDFARGSERIFYWLFNQFGQPNSSPVGSDLFFETYNAYVHIDIKTVQTDNSGDYTTTMFVGDNQNSYSGKVVANKTNKEKIIERDYKAHLPTFYTKKIGKKVEKKICLTYLITILYDKRDLDIYNISVLCIPNGELKDIYQNDVWTAGKNPGKVRFNFSKCSTFRTLKNLEDNSRIKIVFQKDKTEFDKVSLGKKCSFWLRLYEEQEANSTDFYVLKK